MAKEQGVLLVLTGRPMFGVHAGNEEEMCSVICHFPDNVLKVAVKADGRSDAAVLSLDRQGTCSFFSVVE